MRVGNWLTTSTKKLASAKIETPRLDCLILLEDVLKKDRSWILAHPEQELSEPTRHSLQALLVRREKHEPLAYIRGKVEFYGRDFLANKNVLVPRPESESIINLLKSQLASTKDENPVIIDVGTGSGSLAITAKLEIPETKVYALDIDPKCLEVAKINAQKNNAEIELLKSDLLSSLPSTIYHLPSTILANLPYVPTNHPINQAAKHEPPLALFGGNDGLDLYRKMFNQIDNLPQMSQSIITESLTSQHEALAALAKAHGYQQSAKEGLAQLFRHQ